MIKEAEARACANIPRLHQTARVLNDSADPNPSPLNYSVFSLYITELSMEGLGTGLHAGDINFGDLGPIDFGDRSGR